mgnify:FL=1
MKKHVVIPANAGIQGFCVNSWIPAFAGMTGRISAFAGMTGWISAFAGMTGRISAFAGMTRP